MTYPFGTRRRRSRYERALKRRKTVLIALLVCVPLLIGVYALSASWSSRADRVAVAGMPGNDLSDIGVDGQSAVNSLPAPDPAPAVKRRSVGSATGKGYRSKKQGRLIYRYSVVPGGVRTPAELAEAAAHDPDVALHYSRLNFRRAHLVRLVADQRMYVSYRKGGRILWTKKPHLIRAGETVITDGKVTARTRCGNRLASKPKGITETEGPTEAQLNQPVAVEDDTYQPPVTELDLPTLPLTATGPTSGPLGEPVFIGPFLGGGGGGGKCTIDPLTHKCKKNRHPPPPVPEPGTLVLVGSGAILALSRKYLPGVWKSQTVVS